jgi:hypothetical protein
MVRGRSTGWAPRWEPCRCQSPSRWRALSRATVARTASFRGAASNHSTASAMDSNGSSRYRPAVTREDLVEFRGELAVPVADQEREAARPRSGGRASTRNSFFRRSCRGTRRSGRSLSSGPPPHSPARPPGRGPVEPLDGVQAPAQVAGDLPQATPLGPQRVDQFVVPLGALGRSEGSCLVEVPVVEQGEDCDGSLGGRRFSGA